MTKLTNKFKFHPKKIHVERAHDYFYFSDLNLVFLRRDIKDSIFYLHINSSTSKVDQKDYQYTLYKKKKRAMHLILKKIFQYIVN